MRASALLLAPALRSRLQTSNLLHKGHVFAVLEQILTNKWVLVEGSVLNATVYRLSIIEKLNCILALIPTKFNECILFDFFRKGRKRLIKEFMNDRSLSPTKIVKKTESRNYWVNRPNSIVLKSIFNFKFVWIAVDLSLLFLHDCLHL